MLKSNRVCPQAHFVSIALSLCLLCEFFRGGGILTDSCVISLFLSFFADHCVFF